MYMALSGTVFLWRKTEQCVLLDDPADSFREYKSHIWNFFIELLGQIPAKAMHNILDITSQNCENIFYNLIRTRLRCCEILFVLYILYTNLDNTDN